MKREEGKEEEQKEKRERRKIKTWQEDVERDLISQDRETRGKRMAGVSGQAEHKGRSGHLGRESKGGVLLRRVDTKVHTDGEKRAFGH
ncbi:uncharacterized protein SPSK_10601 [Sporothrix schenckii 1099-18]|uniref:Uncharacterized protein n=1 Tax=Sporothrix schenckii 1099-18 TaxID=1397361 RepID=A0A0F2M0K2_SPOSC|nr:uncharacterized protein SPSK_10601 [Sporothrix schenckii 1099-18]KJR83243.1 hypothetical protein SPSK_10601 [Sporothrix schenckii 1099-18]